MTIARLDERLARAEAVLAKVAAGQLEQKFDLGAEVDALTGLEMGINFLILDLRQVDRTNREQRDALLAQRRELEEKVQKIQEQTDAIRKLTTPILEIWEDVLVLPIIGVLDAQRSATILEDLLTAIVERRARCVILDITGVDVVDTMTADVLLRMVRGTEVLGARCVLTGLSPAVAQTLVGIGGDLSAVRTMTNLRSGLRDCVRALERERGV